MSDYVYKFNTQNLTLFSILQVFKFTKQIIISHNLFIAFNRSSVASSVLFSNSQINAIICGPPFIDSFRSPCNKYPAVIAL